MTQISAPLAPPPPVRSSRFTFIISDILHRLATLSIFVLVGAIAVILLDKRYHAALAAAYGCAFLCCYGGLLMYFLPGFSNDLRRQGRSLAIFAAVLLLCCIVLMTSRHLRNELATLGYLANRQFRHQS